VEAYSIRTTAIGVAMDPKMGLGSRCLIRKRMPTTIHEKDESTSNEVAKGTKPEKIALCKIDNVCEAKPTAANQSPH
jgi:hypothetical protein